MVFQDMQIDNFEISLGYKHSLKKLGGNKSIGTILTCSPEKKLENYLILRGTKYVFQSLKAPVKMSLEKKKFILRPNSLFQCAIHQIQS